MTDGVARLVHEGARYQPQRGARVLLMTATVRPPPSAVARSDPAVRLGDYAEALRFYLSLPAERFDRVVLADNSASDLSPLLEAAQACDDKAVELLSFQANDHAPALGKAYGEFRLMDTALAQSRLVGPSDRVWKTTGRLRCLNLARLDAAIPDGVDLACDLHNVPFVNSGRLRGGEMMDARLFAFRLPFYDANLRGQWQSRANGFDARFLYEQALQARGRWRVLPRFPLQPRIAGRSGRTERDYAQPSQRFKDGVRGVMRRLAPGLWL